MFHCIVQCKATFRNLHYKKYVEPQIQKCQVQCKRNVATKSFTKMKGKPHLKCLQINLKEMCYSGTMNIVDIVRFLCLCVLLKRTDSILILLRK